MKPLISAEELLALMSEPEDLRIVDCRFSLGAPEEGEREYQRAHIPGAVYAHLEQDLSGSVTSGVTGRHPLPEVGTLAGTFGKWGISEECLVVAYDDGSCAFAARLWWLLLYLGHDRVRVLDGGLAAYLKAGGSLTQEGTGTAPVAFQPKLRTAMLALLTDVLVRSGSPAPLLFDARAPERFRGEIEPIDRIAGHIPGARPLPFQESLDQGRFLPAERLRDRFLLACGSPERWAEAIVYCGSGVTACHLVLASCAANLPLPRLYAGSYSEWIADGTRPVAVGDA